MYTVWVYPLMEIDAFWISPSFIKLSYRYFNYFAHIPLQALFCLERIEAGPEFLCGVIEVGGASVLWRICLWQAPLSLSLVLAAWAAQDPIEA